MNNSSKSHSNFNINAFFIILISIILIVLAIIYIKNTFNPVKESNPVIDIYKENNVNDSNKVTNTIVQGTTINLDNNQKKIYNDFLCSSYFLNSFNIISNDINKNEYNLAQNKNYIINYVIKWSYEFDIQNASKNIIKYSENKYKINYDYLKNLLNNIFSADLTTMIDSSSAVNGILYYTSDQNGESDQFSYILNYTSLSFDQSSGNYLLYFNKIDKNSNAIQQKYIFAFHVDIIDNINNIKPNYIKLQ